MLEGVTSWFPMKIWEKLTALIFAVLAYFMELRGVINIMAILFVVDIIFGWLKSRKLYGAPFDPSIVWNKSVPRILVSVMVLLLTYSVDKETGQQWVHTANIFGGVFSYLLIASISRNGYHLTGWKIFAVIGLIAKLKIEKEIGVVIEINDLIDKHNEGIFTKN